jgi:alkylation response protein AidB-like acyl-CoA dehydrogenase
MDFLPTDEQVAMADAVAQMCHRQLRGRPRRVLDPELCTDRDWWALLEEAGVFALRSAENAGGLGLGLVDAVIVFDQLGYFLAPGPLVATHLARLLPDLDNAQGLAYTHLGAVGSASAADAHRMPHIVEHLGSARLIISDGEGLRLVESAEVAEATALNSMDPGTPVHAVAVLPAGRRVAESVAGCRWLRDGTLLTAALQVGIAARATEFARVHAVDRHAFGQQIGTFQAVKHKVADMLVRTEVARCAVHAAASVIDENAEAPHDVGVAQAKLLADAAAVDNSLALIQVQAGMGFTWESDAHLLLKRARVYALNFAGRRECLSIIADSLEDAS